MEKTNMKNDMSSISEKTSRNKEIKQFSQTCPECGKPVVQPSIGRHKKFCSEECRRAWWKKNECLLSKGFNIIKCKYCGKDFKARKKHSRFCSPSCYVNHRFGSIEI